MVFLKKNKEKQWREIKKSVKLKIGHDKSACDIFLGEDFELILKKDFRCAILILDAHGQSGFATGTGEEGVSEVNIDLRLKQRLKDIFEVGGTAGKLNDDEIRLAKSKRMLLKEGSG